MNRTEWPAGRVLAVIGGLLGMVLAVAMITGASYLAMPSMPALSSMILGGMGVVHLVLAVLVFINAGLMMNNLRVHGGLLIVWGVLGVFLGFGFWIGAVLVLVGGVLGLLRAPAGGVMGRRPVV